MALGSRLWRPVPVDCWEWLEDLSPLAQRTWFWLWTGPTSTPHGVVSVRPYHAAGALKTKPSALLAALSELEQAGRIVMQQGAPSRIDLYLVGYLPAQCSVRPVQRNGIKRGIERVDLGLPTKQALEDWAIWDRACRKADDSLESGWTEPEPQQKQKQKQEKEQEKSTSVAKATDTSAVAAEPKRAKTLAQDPPDLEATILYFQEQGSTEREARTCHDHFLSQGWKRGKTPIADWLATCRNWMRNEAKWSKDGKKYRPPNFANAPAVEAKAPTAAELDFSAAPAASQADSWREAEALKVWRKRGKQGPAPPTGGTAADYAPWLD